MTSDLPAAIVCFLVVALTTLLGYSIGTAVERNKAIKSGVAEYRLVSRTDASTEFCYITVKTNQ